MFQIPFQPAKILLPPRENLPLWPVIACDQFTSDRAYWERMYHLVGDAPSALHLILPEALLDSVDPAAAAEERNQRMRQTLPLLQTPGTGFVYVEREVTGGKIRRGIVGMLDLESYDWHPGTDAPVRSSERTVPERLPVRIAIRRRAVLELPHCMLLMNDPEGLVLRAAEAAADRETLYDMDLPEQGGHIRGRLIPGEAAARVARLAASLPGEAKLIVGDGNHSLAAAKACWEERKQTLTASERETDPMRFALTEVNSAFDEGMAFEPIHRVLLGTNENAARNVLRTLLSGGQPAEMLGRDGEETIGLPGECLGERIAAVQDALEQAGRQCGGTIDYIHDEAELQRLSALPGSVGIRMPEFHREELFRTVERGEVFPKKSFSIGNARDKRYYMEARALMEAEK